MGLVIRDVRFGYEKNKEIIHKLSLDAAKGELISVVGPNGCGKTTFVKCINGILSARSGNISIDNNSIHNMRREQVAKYIGYVPQMTKDIMGGTVMDAVIMGRKPYINWKLTKEDIDIALDILNQLKIAHLANCYLSDLSGGQKQKVLIARDLPKTQ